MKKTLTTEVLIAGAGPTGLMAANQLSRFGIDFIIVDKKDGPTKESRAIAVTARSLEIYQQMDIEQQAIVGGKKIKSFNLYSNGKRKAEVKIGELGKGLSEFSYMLAFEQSKNEELLASRLTAQDKSVHWNYELLELTEYKNNITALVKHKDEEILIKAQYLIACDGAHSIARKQLHFSFKGGTYENKFFVADIVIKWDAEYDQLVIAPGDKNFCAFLPLYGDHNYRIIGSIPKSISSQDSITFQDIEKVIAKTAGLNLTFEKINWFSTYKLHHRRVSHFSKDRVFLAGDSAHIHSPAGGQGMNTGLQDSYNLCWKMAFVLKNLAVPSLLETYNEERLPFAKWLLQFTDRGFNMMTNDHWLVRFFRKHIALNLAGIVISNKKIRSFAFKIISQIWYSYKGKKLSGSSSNQKLSFHSGDRLPYLPEGNIYPLLTGACFHLLHINSNSLNEEFKERIEKLFPFPVKIIETHLNEHWKKLGVNEELFILVRPDNYIAYLCDDINEKEIKKYLSEFFIPLA